MLCRVLTTLPEPQHKDVPGRPLHGLRPCLAIVPVDNAADSPSGPAPAQPGAEGACELENAGSSGMVQLYTLRTHSVVQTLHFNSRVLSVRASCRLLIVALDAQVGAACNPAQLHLMSTRFQTPLTEGKAIGARAKYRRVSSTCIVSAGHPPGRIACHGEALRVKTPCCR